MDKLQLKLFMNSFFAHNLFSNPVVQGVAENIYLSGTLENRSVRCLKTMKAAPYPFILSHHSTLCVSIGFELSLQTRKIRPSHRGVIGWHWHTPHYPKSSGCFFLTECAADSRSSEKPFRPDTDPYECVWACVSKMCTYDPQFWLLLETTKLNWFEINTAPG